MVLQALLTVAADAARQAGADGDAFADREARDGAADFLDHARHFMAQHHGLLHANGAEAALLEVVQVGAADAAKAHANAQLPGKHFRRGHVFDAQIAGGVDDESVHVLRFLCCI